MQRRLTPEWWKSCCRCCLHVGKGQSRDMARFPRLKGRGYQVISFLETGSDSGEISPSARNDVFSSARRRIARRVSVSSQLQLRRARTRKQFRGRNKRIESPLSLPPVTVIKASYPNSPMLRRFVLSHRARARLLPVKPDESLKSAVLPFCFAVH